MGGMRQSYYGRQRLCLKCGTIYRMSLPAYATMVGSALAGWIVFWAVLVGILGSIQPGIIMAVGTLSARAENRAVVLFEGVAPVGA